MLSATTVQNLKTLSLTELKRFGDFVKSPYFNTSSAIEKIYEAVLKAHPDFNSETLNYENMAKILFGSSDHTEKRIKNLYSEYGNLLKKFIGYEAIAADGQELDVYIAKGLTLRGLYDISNKLIVKSMKEYDIEGNLLFEDRFRYLFWLDCNYSDNLGINRGQGDKEYIQCGIGISEKLIIFFYSMLFKLSLDDIINSKIFKYEENEFLTLIHNATDFKLILAFLESKEHDYFSFLKIRYLFYYYSFNEISELQYTDLKSEFLKGVSRFNKGDKVHFIYQFFQMIHLKMVPINSKYLNDVLELIDLLRKFRIYPDDLFEVFSDQMFRDVFVTAIMLEKFEWAKSFSEEFINYLNKDVRENLSYYCAGHLSFFAGRYEESLEHFGKTKMIGINEKLEARFFSLMNYIELNALESALSSITSLRQFCIDSSEIPERYRPLIEISLKYFNYIIRCLEKGVKFDEQIYSFAGSERFMQKNYVLKKMKQLM